MTIPATGPISLSTIQGEFGGASPISLSEYYRGAAYVPAGLAAGPNGLIPTTGSIPFSKFRGVTKALPSIDITIVYPVFGGGQISVPFNGNYSITATASAMLPNTQYRMRLLGTPGVNVYPWAVVTTDSSGSATNYQSYFNDGSQQRGSQTRYVQILDMGGTVIATSPTRSFTLA